MMPALMTTGVMVMPRLDPRERAFRQTREAQLRRIARLDRLVARDVRQAFDEARVRIRSALAGEDLSDFAQARLTALLPEIDRQAAALAGAMADLADEAVATGAVLGADMARVPLMAAGVSGISSSLTAVSATQIAGIRNFTTGKIRNISNNLAREIGDELALALTGAVNRQQVLGFITARVTGGMRRAQTIVNTELGRAYSTAAQDRLAAAAEDVPGLKKQWRRSGKLRSRPSHDRIDGQVVGVDEKFRLKAGLVKLNYPRDPAGPAAETINCGCTSLPFVEDWEMAAPGAQPLSDDDIARLNTAGGRWRV
ncbi:MAG: hypothetical protein J4F41_00190 [Alphaproteobacteria bacterium]|nr:hypothetical protein [Alphaproteobacteria bacterium]